MFGIKEFIKEVRTLLNKIWARKCIFAIMLCGRGTNHRKNLVYDLDV